MLSAFVHSGEEPPRLASTLSSLVPGAVEGLLREVIVVDGGMGEGSLKVAEHAGCTVCAAEMLGEALRAAKGEWLLLLPAGARLPAGWVEAVADHLGSEGAKAARFRGSWPAALLFRPGLSAGFLARKQALVAAAGSAPTLEALARSSRSVRLPLRLA